ncbi:flagellar hook-length control protein FliK [Nitrincola iocasae]|uniref:Flagellar hook-length control protein-like C-terminal domain-containing protein n=1 Tax=Nitrincola iocasae TaxID=2614693 RepID=A0A5J6LGA8_9GAMM|nr:flagellar hook-length control protein FliK [Nitrincola iocasae]QEW07604.1 hypothetical protein F5I99_14450 [Nitrincola iocasae]
MQSYLNIRANHVSNEASQTGRGTDIARMLPAGKEASATVQRVSQNPAQPGQFTVQLQSGNRTLELTTQRPLPQGSQVILSRDTEGNLQLRLPINTGQSSAAQMPGQSGAGNAQNAPAQARAAAEAFLLRITAGSLSQANSLPLNQPVRGVVISQPAVAAQTAPLPGSTPATATPGSGGNTSPAAATPSTSGNPTNTAPATTAPTTSGSPASTTPATATPATATSATPASSASATSTVPATTAPASSASSNTSASNTAPGTSAPAGSAATAAATAASAAATFGSPTSPAAALPAAVAGANALAATITSQPLPLQTSGQQPTQANVQPAPLPPATTTPGQSSAPPASGAPQAATAPPLTTPTTPLVNALGQAETASRPQGYPVRVLVAGQAIDLVSPRPIQAGQQVEVSRNDQGLLRLQITQPALPLSQQPGIQAIMQQALREVLPVQLPLADGLNQLMQISERQGVKQNSALNQLIQSMLGLFSVKPGSADADKAIARNLQQGGLLSEAGLNRASGERAPPPDLKQQLGQLLKLADQLPPQAREQLTQLINSLLARSTAQQISSLQGWKDLPDGGQERHFRLDLPIQQDKKFDNAELRITEHRRRDEQGNFVTLWSVRLHFELEEDGSIDADINLQDNFQLSASFWVEKPETLGRLRERLNGFEGDLKRKGFDVSPLNARLGKMANPELTPLQKRLVDVHT